MMEVVAVDTRGNRKTKATGKNGRERYTQTMMRLHGIDYATAFMWWKMCVNRSASVVQAMAEIKHRRLVAEAAEPPQTHGKD